MKQNKLVALMIRLAIIAGGATASLWLLATLLLPGCDNDIVRALPSPDQQLKAIVFIRACGATTGFNTQLSLLEAGQTLDDEAGNLVILDNHPEQNRLTLRWLDNHHLQIGAETPVRIFRQNTNWQDRVRIDYQFSQPAS